MAAARRRVSREIRLGRDRRRLLAHRWPGNIRELAHTLERAIVFEESPVLDFPNLAAAAAVPEAAAKPGPEGDWLNPAFHFPAGGGFDLESAINRLVLMALKATKHNVTAAARLLGVTRDYVRYRLEEKGLARALEAEAPEQSPGIPAPRK
ncbi:MAG: hypothetical protein FJ386_13615 [Verrucomicrobia bacterium]|nr:hypothetical protein [Verrucomicrobiota bacterium]